MPATLIEMDEQATGVATGQALRGVTQKLYPPAIANPRVSGLVSTDVLLGTSLAVGWTVTNLKPAAMSSPPRGFYGSLDEAIAKHRSVSHLIAWVVGVGCAVAMALGLAMTPAAELRRLVPFLF